MLWYWGIAAYLPNAPPISRIVVGLRVAAWTVAITASWLLVPLWIAGHGASLPAWLTGVLVIGSVTYVGIVLVGTLRVGGLRGLALLPLVPVFALLEQAAPLYALVRRQTEFVVIEK